MKTIRFENFDHEWFRNICLQNGVRFVADESGQARWSLRVEGFTTAGDGWIQFDGTDAYALRIRILDQFEITNVNKRWFDELVEELNGEIANSQERQYMADLRALLE